MARKPAQEWDARIAEYNQRHAELVTEGLSEKAADESIKADFKARYSTDQNQFSVATFSEKLRLWRKAQAGTTAKEDTTTKVKTARRKPSDTGGAAPTERRDPAQSISLQDIIVDPAIQQRVHMTFSLVDEYVELMTDSEETLPPVVVFGPTDNERYYLSEGFHRYEATKKMGYLAIPAEIRPGGYDEAIDYACEANTKHGLRPSEQDRMKAVATQLEKWPARGNREIARKCGVSPSTVAKHRRGYIEGSLLDNPARTDKDIAQEWGTTPDTVHEYREACVRNGLQKHSEHSDKDIAQTWGVSPDVVAIYRVEIYPPKAEEPSHETSVHLDTSHESQGQDASIPPDHEITVQVDTHHEWTPEVQKPHPHVSAHVQDEPPSHFRSDAEIQQGDTEQVEERIKELYIEWLRRCEDEQALMRPLSFLVTLRDLAMGRGKQVNPSS